MLWSAILLVSYNKLTADAVLKCILYPDKGGLWFLWVLFFINVIFVLCSSFAEKIKVKHEIVILAVCFALVGLMTVFDIRVFGFQFIAYYFLFYSIGYFLHKYGNWLITNNVYLIAALTIMWAVMAWFWNMHELPAFMIKIPIPSSITQYTYRFITAFVAVYVIICISPNLFNTEAMWNKPFVSMGIVSLGIYTTHFIFLGYIVSWFASIISSDMVVIGLALIIGALVSWIIVWVLSKWKVTSQLLLGKI